MREATSGARKVSSALARVFAVWRTGLPRPVLVLQGGNALNYFGTGLILPFEIIYLHTVRGFSTATAGLVLATVMGTAAVVTLPSGALLDRFSAKRILDRGQCRERPRLRGLGVCRPSLARLPLLGGRRCRLRIRGNGRPSPDVDPGPGGAARRIDRAPTSRRQLRSRPRGDGCGLHRRGHPSSPPGVPGALPLRRSHVRRLRAGCARPDPGSWPRGCSVGARGRTGFPSCCSGSALARFDRGQPRSRADRRRVLLQHPPAVCGGAYTCRGR